MKKILATMGLLLAAGFTSQTAVAASGIKVGILTCRVDGGPGFILGSSRDAACTFTGLGGRSERYTGSFSRVGLDIGVKSDTVLVWTVFAPGKLKAGSLRGSYSGVGAEATVGLGVGANVMLGGFRKSINLQPVSYQAQIGLDIAGGITHLHLKSYKKANYGK
jgi:hypothetical protein